MFVFWHSQNWTLCANALTAMCRQLLKKINIDQIGCSVVCSLVRQHSVFAHIHTHFGFSVSSRLYGCRLVNDGFGNVLILNKATSQYNENYSKTADFSICRMPHRNAALWKITDVNSFFAIRYSILLNLTPRKSNKKHEFCWIWIINKIS